jgi:hypothetical protein
MAKARAEPGSADPTNAAPERDGTGAGSPGSSPATARAGRARPLPPEKLEAYVTALKDAGHAPTRVRMERDGALEMTFAEGGGAAGSALDAWLRESRRG